MIVLGQLAWAIAFVVAVYRVARAWETVAAPPVKPAPPVLPEVPEDLMALAMQENEAWAQEEMVRVIRERYETLRDWNRVRAAMGIGRIDA